MTAPVSFLRPGRRTVVARAVAMAAVAFAAGGLPVAANAQLSPNPNFGDISVESDVTEVNEINFFNYGNIYISGVLNNSGFLYNEDDGLLRGQINNYGTLNNSGFLNNNSGLDNYFGVLNNSGSLINTVSFEIYIDSEVRNTGRLDNWAGGYLVSHGLVVNEATGIVTNDGFFGNGWDNKRGTFTNRGIVNNNDNATLSNPGNLVNEAGGTLVNSGLLSNDSDFDFNGVTIVGGVLTNAGNLINAFGGWIQNLRVLVNSDTITNTAGSWMENFASLTNLSTGLIENLGKFDNNAGLITNHGRLVNSSNLTIYSGAAIVNEAGGTLTNSGDLVNSAGGTLSNRGDLTIESGALFNRGGNLINEAGGKLYNNFGILGNSGTLINNGTVTNNSFFETSASGSVTGTGTYIQTYGWTNNKGTMTQALFDIQAGTISGDGVWNGPMKTGLNVTDLRPGNTPGTMVINGDLTTGSNIFIEIAGSAAGEYDVLEVNGILEFIGGLITIEFIDGYLPGLDDTFNFIVADSSIGWDKLKWAVTGLGAGFEWNIAYGDDGAYIDITAVPGTGTAPEPGTYALVLAGLGLMGLLSRRGRAMAA